MTNTKSLMLAAVASLSLGVGTAMAQDSAFFTEQAQQWPHSHVAPMTVHSAANAVPQYGSADRAATTSSWPVLEGGDGAGG
jgi:hypothetical protein